MRGFDAVAAKSAHVRPRFEECASLVAW